VQALVGTLESTLTFSVSPQDRLVGAPEQPDYDASSKITMGPLFAPSVSGGVLVRPHRLVRIGLSAQSPAHVDTEAKLVVRLPGSPVFDRASVRGDRARVTFDLPGIVRIGVELRPTRTLRVEGTWVRELWSVHKAILASPQGITLDGLVGGPPSLAMPDINTPRNFQDSNSFRLGLEYQGELARRRIDVRGGLGYETSAVPVEYMSLSSLDFDKTTLTVGASVHLGERWRLDALYGHVFVADAYVPPDQARIPRVSALAGNAPLEAINGGTYTASSELVGLGLNYLFR
jgi:long-chain fatty acid transport protein